MKQDKVNTASSSFSLPTQTALLLEVQAGDENAWRDFYCRYAAMINNIGKQRHLTAEECDDLMIDVMVIFWKRIDSYIARHQRGKFRKYLTKLTTAAADRIFRKNHKEAPPAEEPEYPDDIDKLYMEEWQNYIFKQALEDLKAVVDSDTYNVFYMSVVQKQPVSDIARITRKTPNNIYVIRSRCLKKLKQQIALYRKLEEAELSRHSHKNILPV